MYLKKLDYTHHPEYRHNYGKVRLSDDQARLIKDSSSDMIDYFMISWMFKENRFTSKWYEQLAKLMRTYPLVLPRSIPMNKSVIVDSLYDKRYLGEKYLISLRDYFTDMYDDLELRKYCETDFVRKFRKSYKEYLDRFVDKLYGLYEDNRRMTRATVKELITGIIEDE